MVEVPTAMPQILVGVNQTTMAALSIVIIAAIIGGFEDIGWEVLSSMRKAAVRPEHALGLSDRPHGHGHRPHHASGFARPRRRGEPSSLAHTTAILADPCRPASQCRL